MWALGALYCDILGIILALSPMATVSTYLNFARETAPAFEFYRSVFGGEFTLVQRFSDIPASPHNPPLADEDKALIMHIELPILGGHRLLGTDAPSSMGFTVQFGNNSFINLEPDTRQEADMLFAGLSAGGKVEMAMQEMFWGGYFGSLTDKYGVQWMINCASKS
jgi:PhnB protein